MRGTHGRAATVGGTHVWSRRFGDANDERGEGVTTDTNGAVIATGWFEGNVMFDTAGFTSVGLTDIFVVKLEP